MLLLLHEAVLMMLEVLSHGHSRWLNVLPEDIASEEVEELGPAVRNVLA